MLCLIKSAYNLLLVGCLALIPLAISAQNTVYFKSGDSSISLDTLWYLEDKTGQMTLEDAQKSTFEPSNKHNFGITSSAYWVKIRINKQTKLPVFFALDYPVMDNLTFYYQDEDGNWQTMTAGDKTSLETIIYKSYQPILPLSNHTDTDEVYYFRFVTNGTMIIQLEAHTLPSLVWKDMTYNVITGIFYGAAVIMILYNLILFFFLGDRSYLAYVLTIIGAPIYSSSMLGHSFVYFHGHLDWVGHELTLVGTSLYFVAIFYFSRLFLDIKQLSKRLNVFLIVMGIIGALEVLGSFVLPYDLMAVVVSRSMILIQFIVLGVAIYCIRKGKKAARFFLIAWLAFVMAGVIRALAIMGALPDNFLTRYCVEVAFFIQIVLFSVALGDRYRLYRKEREEAQEKLLEMQQQETEKLERLVNERTAELKQKQEEVLVQNEELHQQQEEITAQRDFIEHKNKELITLNEHMNLSIQYASNIQKAILPENDKLKASFSDVCILNIPRDVVSGDFYWFTETNNYQFLAVVDCTGHGVPGAFMSMIGSSLLNEIINISHIHEPAEILEQLHKRVNSALKQAQTGNTDGMDVCLCRFQKTSEGMEVVFSGAKRSLVIVNQVGELQELKGDRRHIGGTQYDDEVLEDFTNQKVNLMKGDRVYLFTDGITDAPNVERKKFGSERLKNTFLEARKANMDIQRKRILSELLRFQQGAVQRDDVLLVGVEI